MESDGGGRDLKEEKRAFFSSTFQPKSKLSSISCQGHFD